MIHELPLSAVLSPAFTLVTSVAEFLHPNCLIICPTVLVHEGEGLCHAWCGQTLVQRTGAHAGDVLQFHSDGRSVMLQGTLKGQQDAEEGMHWQKEAGFDTQAALHLIISFLQL